MEIGQLEVSMIKRYITVVAILGATAILAVPPVVVAQTGGGWTVPRTPTGTPDLQGVWSNNTATPFQRPEQFGDKAVLTDEEVAELIQRVNEFRDDDQAGDLLGDFLIQKALDPTFDPEFDRETGDYNAFWLVERKIDSRTSVIIDPPTGRVPPLSEAGKARLSGFDPFGTTGSDGPENRTLSDRCLHWDVPNLIAGYNSYFQIFQTPTQVVILQELGHLVRTIPLDERPHLGEKVPQWAGSSRGWWDGDTLVVETRNYDARSSYGWTSGSGGAASKHLLLVERFTRPAPNVLRQEITLNDLDTWTQPWTIELLLESSDDPLFEYACHEGNYAMEGILAGARAEEAAASDGSR